MVAAEMGVGAEAGTEAWPVWFGLKLTFDCYILGTPTEQQTVVHLLYFPLRVVDYVVVTATLRKILGTD